MRLADRILFYKGVKNVPDRIPPLTISRAIYKAMRINTLWQSLYVRYLATGRQTTVSSVVWLHCFCASISGRDNATSRPFESCFDVI